MLILKIDWYVNNCIFIHHWAHLIYWLMIVVIDCRFESSYHISTFQSNSYCNIKFIRFFNYNIYISVSLLCRWNWKSIKILDILLFHVSKLFCKFYKFEFHHFIRYLCNILSGAKLNLHLCRINMIARTFYDSLLRCLLVRA